ncbi:unnamed protein product [Rotaria sordida]|uniref:F-box domain-containing protein n=1 Tax=Rotaria sordida TaxID=392033 RepID=A0A815ZNY4_9BILA|nr:unnamed protein product [Rotaria sordida]CAF1584896.1 unnamed protein product [Rotaria sordida]
MSNSCVELNDLPDEILMIIFKKLNTIDVLYSLHGSNQRLHKIVYDPIFTSYLTFVKRFSHNFINLICSDMMLNRFCSQILPEIHDKIKWLNLESSSMKHVLCTADYPNLYGLGLYNIDEESIRCLFTEAKQVLCHIYSYSSPMQYYSYITNNFPDGLFKYVRVVSLFDEHPFEHEFFLRIQKSFPFMERLCVINHKSQNHKQSYESNNDNRISSVIEYSFLSELDIDDVHDDYIEQFLFDTKTYLQSNVLLYINYESLKRLTHNFKRDATRINCAKVNELKFRSGAKCPNSSLQEYFPNAKIYYRGIF